MTAWIATGMHRGCLLGVKDGMSRAVPIPSHAHIAEKPLMLSEQERATVNEWVTRKMENLHDKGNIGQLAC